MSRNSPAGAVTEEPARPGMEPVAILGYAVQLPAGPTGENGEGCDLRKVAQNQETTFEDYLDTGYLRPCDLGDNPWLYQHRVGTRFVGMDRAFDPTLFQISEKESNFMTSTQKILMAGVWDGLEKAGIPPRLLHKTRTGVFVAAFKNFGGFLSYPDETAIRSALISGLSDRIAYFLGTHGPSLTIETACSSSLVALTLAVNAIRDGSCDVAIVSAVNVASREYELALQATGVISRQGECRPFDEDASGTLRCEGQACMVICSMNWAKNHGYSGTIKSVIVNSTIGSAGADPTVAQGSGRLYESPNVFGMAEMIRLCHEQVGLPLEKISYVEAHATGTKVGDLIELQALAEVYGASHDAHRNPLRVGSVKGNIGHSELAAGLVSLIKVVEMNRVRTFFPTGGHNIRPRSDFDWLGNNVQLCLENEPYPTDRQCYLAVNSFGVGGTYAVTIVKEYYSSEDDGEQPPAASVRPLLLTVSAVSASHLVVYEERILEYLQKCPGEVSLLSLCGFFATNRRELGCSRSYIVDSMEDLMGQLASDSKSKIVDDPSSKLKIAMVFTGQGSQWVGMGLGLMQFEPYRDVVTRFDRLWRKLSGWSPLEKLTSLSDDELYHTMYAQPLTFMVQVGLVELLGAVGVRADIVVGHSAGEMAAQYCSGMLSLSEATKVVWHRSVCQQTLAGNGRMLAVQMGVKDAKEMLRDPSLGFSASAVACDNAPNSTVLSGPAPVLDRVKRYLSTKDVKSTFLKGNTAFHCSLMDPVLAEVDARLRFLNQPRDQTASRAMAAPEFYSSVTGRLHTSVTSKYIVHNIRQPVKFRETVDILLTTHEPDVFLEVGPSATLAPLVDQCVQAAKQQATVISSLSKGVNDVGCFWKVIKGLREAGIDNINLAPIYKRDLGYTYRDIEGSQIPGHPKINSSNASKWIGSHGANHNAVGKLEAGPAAGAWVPDTQKLTSVIEISKATSSPMDEHIMGGIAILPGMYFVEAAIETFGLGDISQTSQGIGMMDVSFTAMCPIPDRAQEQPRKLFVKHSVDKSGKGKSFTVESVALLDGSSSSDAAVQHCTGHMVSFARPEDDVLDGFQYIPSAMGTWKKSPATRDIGLDGLELLLESHRPRLSKSHFYAQNGDEEIAYYGPSFQVIEEIRANASGSSIVATLRYDHQSWSAKGGIFGVQLLDGMLQLCFLNPYVPSGNVMYAGGFDWGLFVRAPVENAVFVHFQFVEDAASFGSDIVHGEAMMYDATGRLLCHLMGIRSIIGKHVTGKDVYESVPAWSPWHTLSLAASTSMAPAVDEPNNVGAGSDLDPRSSAIAQTIGDILRKKHALMRGQACFLRVMELWDDAQAMPAVLAALVSEAFSVPGFDFLVEVFVGTHDENMIKRTYRIPQKHSSWLKLRLVSLPMQAAVSFDVLSVMRMGGAGGGHWDDPMDFLRFASEFGHRGSVLLHDFDASQTQSSWVEGGYVTGCVHHPVTDGGGGYSSCSLLDEALVCTRGDERRSQNIFIVSRDTDLSRQLGAAFEQLASTSGCSALVSVQERSVHRADEEAIRQLAADASCSPGDDRHLIILDGMVDESEYAQDTFVLSARVRHELVTASSSQVHLWLVTSNAYVHPINIHRSSILPLVGIGGTEYVGEDVRIKYVDLPGVSSFKDAAGPRPFELLASLVLSRPGPDIFMIDVDGVVHDRLYLPVEVAAKPRLVPVPADDPGLFFKLELVKPARTRSTGRPYEFFSHQVTLPETGEVLVDVQHASLNFRDVMLSLNALPRSSMEGSFYGHDLGMEAAGIVMKVGPGVDHVVPGDRVMVSARGCLASKVIAPAGDVNRLDNSVTTKDAASLAVYLTAYHALVDLCRLRKGDRVLVHAAAGGVGHAAISICRHFEADVYATVSHAKREYCVKMLGVPESQVFNSRDMTWFDDLMRCTDDDGVDIVINSLTGEHQLRGLQALRPGGRFCEIGKADIFNNERLFQFAFRKNIQFFAIDMDRMKIDDPATISSVSGYVVEGLAAGHLKPLPYICFPMNKIQDAMELIKSGQHIGKVLLSNLVEDGPGKGGPLTVQSKAAVRFGGETFHLVLGGAGGIGSKLVRWLHQKGARRFIVSVSRDPTRVMTIFEDLIATGATFEVVEADLSCDDGYGAIEKTVFGPLVGGRVETCVHSVGFWEAFSPFDVPDDVLKRQSDLKVQSAIFLDRLARKLGPVVRQFILIGSNSSGQTNWNFASYGASNAMLAAVGRRRLADGLPSTVCHLPTLFDVGIVASNVENFAVQKKMGYTMINAASVTAKLELMLAEGVPEVFCAMGPPHGHSHETTGSEWRARARVTPCFEQSLVFGNSSHAMVEAPKTLEDVLATVVWALADSMGIDESNVKASMSLASLGLDSLGMMDFSQQLVDRFGYQIDRTAFAMTVGDLAKDVLNRTKKAAAVGGGEDGGENDGEDGGMDGGMDDGEDGGMDDGEDDHGPGDDHGHGMATTSLIECSRRIANPKGVVLICAGFENPEKRRVTRFAFAQWEQSGIQVLHVEMSANVSVLRRETIEDIGEELIRGGYLGTGVSEGQSSCLPCVVVGWSYGAFMALEVCRVLLDVHSYRPAGFVPVCMSAPTRMPVSGAWSAVIYSLLPKAYQKRLMRKTLEVSYQSDDPKAAGILRAMMPNVNAIMEHDRSRREYAATVVRELKQCRREGRSYIGDTEIHHVNASHDHVGNREGIGGSLGGAGRTSTWAAFTARDVEQTFVYGNHACLFDPTYGELIRDCIFDIVQGMIDGYVE